MSQNRLARLWRDHSLSIVAGGIGGLLWIASQFMPEGKWFDNFNGAGLMFGSIGVLGWLCSRFREVRKPED